MELFASAFFIGFNTVMSVTLWVFAVLTIVNYFKSRRSIKQTEEIQKEIIALRDKLVETIVELEREK